MYPDGPEALGILIFTNLLLHRIHYHTDVFPCHFQDPVAVGGCDSNLPHDIPVPALSVARLHRPQKGHEVAAINAESRPLLLLALSALSNSRNDRRQFVLAPAGGPAASHCSGYLLFSAWAFEPWPFSSRRKRFFRKPCALIGGSFFFLSSFWDTAQQY